MTIAIDLPEDTGAILKERARGEGKPAAELAAEVLTAQFRSDYQEELPEELPLDAGTIEKIRRGFADMDAGRTVPLDEARTGLRDAFAARYRDTKE